MVEQASFSASPKPPNGTSVEMQTHISSLNFNDNGEFKMNHFLRAFSRKISFCSKVQQRGMHHKYPH